MKTMYSIEQKLFFNYYVFLQANVQTMWRIVLKEIKKKKLLNFKSALSSKRRRQHQRQPLHTFASHFFSSDFIASHHDLLCNHLYFKHFV